MNISERDFVIIMLGFALIMLVTGGLQFMEKGFPLNSLYMYVPKEEREKVDKKPYYRQSAIIFTIFGIFFILTAIASVTGIKGMFYIIGGGTILLLVYAVISSANL